MPSFGVILAAAGQSRRFGNRTEKKPFISLQGKAVWLYSAELFRRRSDVTKIVLVVSPTDRQIVKDRFEANLALSDIALVDGGDERFDSVAAGLRAIGDEVDYVAVHDAARPCVQAEHVDLVFKSAIECGAAILGVPVHATLKKTNADKQIQETIDRTDMWLAQTPQVAKREWLQEAYDQRGDLQSTDEAQLLERAGRAVSMVEGSPLNLKLTTPTDMKLAKMALEQQAKVDHLGLLSPDLGRD